jgi:hypothetical protein
MPTNNKRKDNWVCHMLRRNCILIHVIEGKIEGRLKVTGRRRQQLLDDLQKKRGYCKLKQEALDPTLWRTRFQRVCGALIRHKKE